MARRSKRPQVPQQPRAEELIVDVALDEELSASYMEYALSVIISRAIPDARDGLKPVQRRILYAMSEAGLRSDRPYRKSIGAVGDTMKKYHPHGDSAIYETLVRMAQDWVMNAPLVDGHGNFGSWDDGPAAARYTEARLSAVAEALLADVEENTVLFSPNFDASTTEPRVLPAGFPALLVNGASGIAVGMATNIPPHNLNEVVTACQILLENPKATLAEVLKVLPAPDFPTGGQVVASREQLREMYSTGRGAVKMRATTEITDVTPRRRGIVVTELPYNVGPERVIARVKELVAQKKLDGIADVKDLTDRKNGLRLVFEVKTGFDPEAVLSELFRLTPLEESFSMNAVALVDGRPLISDLLTLLTTYVNHRIEVIRRRCAHRLAKARARLHILTALIAALEDIDEVVRIIRGSKDTETARTKLMKRLKVDLEQANHILDMPLRRLTTLEVSKLRDEVRELQRTAKELEAVLKSEKKQREMVSAELHATREKHGVPRRSKVVDPAKLTVVTAQAPAAPTATAGKPKAESRPALQIASEPASVGVLADGRIRLNPEEPVLFSCETTTTSTVFVVSSTGRAWPVPVAELPANAPVAISAFSHEEIRCVGVLAEATPLALATRDGVVKRLSTEAPTALQLKRAGEAGLVLITLKGDDHVVAARPCTDESELVFVTQGAQLLRTKADTVRPQGRSGGGVAGVKLRKDDSVVAFAAVADAALHQVVVVTDGLSAKVSPLAEYPTQGRATGGVRCLSFKKQDSRITLAMVATSDIVALDARAKVVKFDWPVTKRDGSGQTMPATPVVLAAR